MSSQPESEGAQVVVRRRRTRRHRRNRLIRRVLLVVCGVMTCGCSLVALHYLSPSLFRTSSSLEVEPTRQAAEASRQRLIDTQQELFHEIEKRKIYRYSVVPGGVKDAHELKWAADHDPAVAAHYAGFDYDHARIIRLRLARNVYLSYRIGQNIFWTRHRVRLQKGEMLISDGKITARTRCANRVEDEPQQATSQAEPPAAKFEEPVEPSTGTAVSTPPVPFQSSLLNRNAPPGLGPAPPLTMYDPIQTGNVVPVFPPPLPLCGPGITKKPGTTIGGGITVFAGKNKKKVPQPCGGGNLPEVPEPSTWLLMFSGLALIYWKMRRRPAQT